MFDPSPKPEPWWPLEWHENIGSGYPTSNVYFHPTVYSIERHVGSDEYLFFSRKNGAHMTTIKGDGGVEDEIALRCALLELAYPDG